MANESEAKILERQKNDAKALCLIQQVVDESIFYRIVRFNTTKEAWEHIQNKYHGLTYIVSVRRQTMRQKFEVLQMKDEGV